jgi:hypothetical protein
MEKFSDKEKLWIVEIEQEVEDLHEHYTVSDFKKTKLMTTPEKKCFWRSSQLSSAIFPHSLTEKNRLTVYRYDFQVYGN